MTFALRQTVAFPVECESWNGEMRYRAQMNMRPAAIWAMEMFAPTPVAW